MQHSTDQIVNAMACHAEQADTVQRHSGVGQPNLVLGLLLSDHVKALNPSARHGSAHMQPSMAVFTCSQPGITNAAADHTPACSLQSHAATAVTSYDSLRASSKPHSLTAYRMYGRLAACAFDVLTRLYSSAGHAHTLTTLNIPLLWLPITLEARQ